VPSDFEDRQSFFGTNFKAPAKRTPFCRLFIGALEDFMLRLLLVCACISIIFDMAFAEDNEERATGKFKF
jgi:Cation transporter/ATPase, N-terminus